MSDSFRIRNGGPADQAGTYYVCMKTGNNGADGESFFRDDPDALGRIYVGPYLEFQAEYALILEDEQGIAGYALAARDSRHFYQQYERHWRPALCHQFPDPTGDPAAWSRLQGVYHLYHHPDYTCPEPYDLYPAHLHIDLLPRAQGQGHGKRLMQELMRRLADAGAPGVHLGMSAVNGGAYRFYTALGFHELMREGQGEHGSIYLGQRLAAE